MASDMQNLPSLDNDECIKDDFSFFGVFDGHDGSYVSQYLQEHLMSYFQQKLLLNASHLSPSSLSASTNSDNLNKDMNIWRTSFLEAACKIDREILLQDSQRLQQISDQREAAFQGTSANGHEASDQGDSSNDTFAGSTAAVVIVYRDTPQVLSCPTTTTTTPPTIQGSMLPPFHPDTEMHEHDTFQEDVVVGVFTKKDSAASVMDTDNDSANVSTEMREVISEPLSDPVKKTLREKSKKDMKRFSSIESNYDSPAVELDLEDDNVFDSLELTDIPQGVPFAKPKHNIKIKRDSNGSNMSDLTASCSNISLLNSSDDLLHQQHAQPFNPKRKSLAVRRSYETNSVEDFTKYEGFQLEELVDDFLQRASMLDKAASDCRGQAAELLQVLQQRVRSGSFVSNKSAQSSCSPYGSSLDASNSMQSALSAHSQRSMNSNDDLSDISPCSGLNDSNKSYSSLGSITSLRSFDDDRIPLKRSNIQFLDTVTESLFESRATSFAASRQASSSTSLGSISEFNEKLRLALVGEIAAKNVKLLIAHAGDCRVVLCDGGAAIQVTIDHTPLIDEEKSRIKESGGFVSNKRVNGILAVSRSFGDIKFKSFNNSFAVPDSALDENRLPEGIWNNRNQVISMPEILELDVLSTYEFVVIASDCVWETLTCAEVILFVRTQMLDHGDTMRAADALAVHVSDEGGMDNCSIIIVNLNQI
jgi:serine/threonine protein phosphatase PrpC